MNAKLCNMGVLVGAHIRADGMMPCCRGNTVKKPKHRETDELWSTLDQNRNCRIIKVIDEQNPEPLV